MERDEFKLSRVVNVAKMYYQLEYSQQAIAKELDISRPTVSRLLQEAKNRGIVQIKINDPAEDGQKLEEVIKNKYKLKDCIIVHVPVYQDEVVKEYLGKKAADYIWETVKSGDIVGATWGTTLFEIARRVKRKDVLDVKVVQLNGGVSHSESDTYASQVLNYLGKAFDTSPHFLPLPAVVDSQYVAQTIVADRHIHRVLELGKKATIALFTVGDPNEGSTLVKADYFTKQDLKVLQEKQAVGDICSRFIDIEGQLCSNDINARAIGIELEDLRRIDSTILVAGGIKKVNGIIGALTGNYANVLITDQFTAKSLVER
ncbi:RNA polymerase subunit sigma-70 [Aquibacillus halophilus]|uniref:RNA polymerase subunit sigma-70 n=1 Tax=Aquibacillus halophilus TaxID=930132 RepID=A0A6A8D7C7_9BACI|nr:sugar-binding transcriptional regulator [Aquibacillus halophilus]MRH41655.1 RNA polymerase subunit sigma-70 [Aquibacillus halophilus]